MKTPSVIPDNDLPGMTLREKSAWVCLVTTVATYIPYFIYIFRLLQGGHLRGSTFFTAWIGAVLLQTALSILAALLFMVRQRKEPKDERDAVLEARSFRYAYGFLAVCCFLLVVIIPHFSLGPIGKLAGHSGLLVLAAQAVLLSFVGAEVVKYLTLAIGYRRAIYP